MKHQIRFVVLGLATLGILQGCGSAPKSKPLSMKLEPQARQNSKGNLVFFGRPYYLLSAQSDSPGLLGDDRELLKHASLSRELYLVHPLRLNLIGRWSRVPASEKRLPPVYQLSVFAL